MNNTLELLLLDNPDGSVVSLVVLSPEQKPISDRELADALRNYADLLDTDEQDTTMN